MIKPAYSFSFLFSTNIFVWQNVLYFLDAPRILLLYYTLLGFRGLIRNFVTNFGEAEMIQEMMTCHLAGERDFLVSKTYRPALESTFLSIQRVKGSLPGGKATKQ